MHEHVPRVRAAIMLPYPSAALGLEVTFVFLYLIVEFIRLYLGGSASNAPGVLPWHASRAGILVDLQKATAACCILLASCSNGIIANGCCVFPPPPWRSVLGEQNGGHQSAGFIHFPCGARHHLSRLLLAPADVCVRYTLTGMAA